MTLQEFIDYKIDATKYYEYQNWKSDQWVVASRNQLSVIVEGYGRLLLPIPSSPKLEYYDSNFKFSNPDKIKFIRQFNNSLKKDITETGEYFDRSKYFGNNIIFHGFRILKEDYTNLIKQCKAHLDEIVNQNVKILKGNLGIRFLNGIENGVDSKTLIENFKQEIKSIQALPNDHVKLIEFYKSLSINSNREIASTIKRLEIGEDFYELCLEPYNHYKAVCVAKSTNHILQWIPKLIGHNDSRLKLLGMGFRAEHYFAWKFFVEWTDKVIPIHLKSIAKKFKRSRAPKIFGKNLYSIGDDIDTDRESYIKAMKIRSKSILDQIKKYELSELPKLIEPIANHELNQDKLYNDTSSPIENTVQTWVDNEYKFYNEYINLITPYAELRRKKNKLDTIVDNYNIVYYSTSIGIPDVKVTEDGRQVKTICCVPCESVMNGALKIGIRKIEEKAFFDSFNFHKYAEFNGYKNEGEVDIQKMINKIIELSENYSNQKLRDYFMDSMYKMIKIKNHEYDWSNELLKFDRLWNRSQIIDVWHEFANDMNRQKFTEDSTGDSWKNFFNNQSIGNKINWIKTSRNGGNHIKPILILLRKYNDPYYYSDIKLKEKLDASFLFPKELKLNNLKGQKNSLSKEDIESEFTKLTTKINSIINLPIN